MCKNICMKYLLVACAIILVVCMMAGCQSSNDSAVTTEPVEQEKDLFYFNIDKAVYGSVERQKDRVTGLYSVRFLKDGEILEIQTSRDNLSSQVDNLMALVLTFDDDGYIKKIQSAQSVLGGQFYENITVTAVDGMKLTVDSRVGTLTMSEDANIYDLTGLTAEIGAYGQVQSGDVVCCYCDETGAATQVYIMKRHPGHDASHTCEHCGSAVEWITWDGTQPLTSGHFCLSGDVNLDSVQVLDGVDVAICLNGYALTGSERLFELNRNAVLSVIDHAGYTGGYTGSMTGKGISVKGKESD